MRHTRRPLALAGVVLALFLVLSISAPASAAAVASSVSAADPADYTPSGSKWRKYMLNMLGSVLGGAMPKGWRAEQIANQYQYNFGAWDDLNARLGIDGVRTDANGNVVGIKYSNRGQGTYTDVVIDKMEAEFSKTAKKGGSGGKPFAVSATNPKALFKTVGGALTAFTAFEVGTMLGSAGVGVVGGWFGFDAQNVVCGQTADGSILSAAVRFLAGQDCSMWDLAPEYVANGDAGTTYGLLSHNGVTVEFLRAVTLSGGTFTYTTYCYKQTGTLQGTGLGFYARSVAGTNNIGYGATLPGVASTSHPCGQLGLSYTNGPKSNGADAQATAGSPAVYIAQSSTGAPVATMPQTKADPERYQECRVTYTDNTTASAQGARYKESTGGVVPAVCPGTPSNKTPKSVRVTDNQVGAGAGGSQTVSDENVTPEYQDWWQNYPECRSGACKLDLYKKTGTAAFAVSCFDLEDGCAGWFEDPDKADTYTCRYGIHDVELSECNVYAGLFKPGAVESGAAYVDPETGEWSGGQTSEKSGQKAFNAKIQDPESMRNCDLSGLGFDPVGWVMRPVQCAFEWAFIPRPAVADLAFAGVQSVWDTKPPGAIAAAMDQVTIDGGGTGCSITTTMLGVTTPIVDACGGFMGGLATFTRFAATALMAFAVFEQVRRQIAGMVNYNVGQD